MKKKEKKSKKQKKGAAPLSSDFPSVVEDGKSTAEIVERAPIEETSSSAEQVIQSLVDAGLVTPPPRRGDVEAVSEEAWRELTQRLEASPGKPLSEIIIEERGQI